MKKKNNSAFVSKSSSNTKLLWVWLGLAGLWFMLDQFTKYLIVSYYPLHAGTEVTSFFNVVHVHNYGAAFSFLAGAGGWQRWFFTVIGVAASAGIIWALRSRPQQKLFCFALACILGGALGNVTDRVLRGYVVDMLDFHWSFLEPVFHGGHFPAFNIADTAISVGAACLILDEILRVKNARG